MTAKQQLEATSRFNFPNCVSDLVNATLARGAPCQLTFPTLNFGAEIDHQLLTDLEKNGGAFFGQPRMLFDISTFDCLGASFLKLISRYKNDKTTTRKRC
jgi:hypothetical protein